MMSSPLTLTCGKCGRPAAVAHPEPSKKYACPRGGCGGTLVDRSEQPTLWGGTPPEVARAAGDPRNRIGKYVLVRELGRGGMGAVHLAWDTSLKRWVALKFLLTSGSEEDVRRFHREAETAASLKHPNIAAIYEVGESEGKPYIAMEFVEGRTLSGQNLELRRACEIARDVARALDYAHQRSIIHRDLKPGNIIVSRGGKPVILDFGLAKSLKDLSKLTMSGTVVGTPCYMAPEQAAGQADRIGPRSDVYQLGAVLYELVARRPPFEGSSPADTLRRVIDEDVARPSRFGEVPHDVETIILRAMDKNPERRFPSAKAFAADLERWLRGKAIVARPLSPLTRLMRLVGRHRTAALGVVLALLVVIAGLGWLVHRESRRADLAEHLRNASDHFGREQYQRALELYSRALELDRENGEIRERLEACRKKMDLLAQAAVAEREKAEGRTRAMKAARPAFERATTLLEDAWRDLYRDRADLVQMRARLKKAIEEFGASLAHWPDNPDALFGRGRAHALRFDYEEADRDFGRATDLRPDFAAARMERGKLLLQRYIDARFNLGWEWDANVEKPFAKWKERARAEVGDDAFVAFAENRMEDCLRHCERRLKEKTEQEELWKLQGDALYFASSALVRGNLTPMQDKLTRGALRAYGEAIRLRPNYYEARMMRGYVSLQRGDEAAALEDVKIAHQLRPDDALACWFRGQTASTPKEALEWYEKGVKIDPGSYICRMNRAYSMATLGQVAEARDELDRSIVLNPTHYYGIYLRGCLRSKSGDMEGALEDFKKVTELAATFHSGWFNLGAAAYNLRRYKEVIPALERALEAGHTDRATIEEIIRQTRRHLGQ